MSLSEYKAFDPKLHAKFDKPAKERILDYMRKGLIKENPDKYGPDILVQDSYYVEVEVREIWKDDNFPFDEIHIPERKTKFFKLDKPCYYFCLSWFVSPMYVLNF